MSKVSQSSSDWLGQKLASLYVVMITLMMSFAGLVALNEGLSRFVLPFVLDDASAYSQELVEQMKADPTVENIMEISTELGFLAKATSPERFVDSKLPEHGVFLASMPASNQLLLLSHVLTGVFCVLIGGFQFWPQFRKRFKKVHRGFGFLYIVTAPVSVVLSFMYMAVTLPHDIYAHFVGWVALWLFGIVAILSIFMAVKAIMNKRPYEHQAWMALSFGCLIVAPMFRWNWALLGIVFPDIDQETLNLVTLAIMLPQVLLIGYGLSLVNRQYQRPMTRREPAAIAKYVKQKFLSSERILQGGVALIAVAVIFAYFLGSGVLSLAPEGQIPQLLINKESTFFETYTWAGPLFSVANIVAIFSGLKLLHLLIKYSDQGIPRILKITFSLSTFSMSLVCLFVGHYIGLESNMKLLSGGATYIVSGVVMAGFLSIFIGAWYVDQRSLMKESLIFIITVLPFSVLLLGGLWLVSFIPLKAEYIAVGQGYMLPAGACFSLLFIAMFYVVYGQSTREHG